MNAVVAVLAIVAAADLPQRLRLLSTHGERERATVAVATLVVVAILSGVADALLDALDISGPNAQIAAGMVLILWSAAAFFGWNEAPVPVAAGGLVPGFFPTMFTPVFGVVVTAIAGNSGTPATMIGGVLVAVIVGFDSPHIRHWVATRGARRATATLGVVTGAVAMTTGVLAI